MLPGSPGHVETKSFDNKTECYQLFLLIFTCQEFLPL